MFRIFYSSPKLVKSQQFVTKAWGSLQIVVGSAPGFPVSK